MAKTRSLLAVLLFQLIFWPTQASAIVVSVGSSARIDYDFIGLGDFGLASNPFKYNWRANFEAVDFDVNEQFRLTLFDDDLATSFGVQTITNIFGASISNISSSIIVSPSHTFTDTSGFMIFDVLVGSFDLTSFTIKACLSSCINSTRNFANVTITPLSPIPLPAALPLYGTGLAVMSFLGWRHKRKAAA